MERSDVAGHQGSGECACEGRSEDMHVFLRHLVPNTSERVDLGGQPTVRLPGSYQLRFFCRIAAASSSAVTPRQVSRVVVLTEVGYAATPRVSNHRALGI